MKAFFTMLLFVILLSVSAFVSEYSLHFVKANTAQATLVSPKKDTHISFFYGWLKCDGKSFFFVQKGFSDSCSEDIPSHLQLREQATQQLSSLLRSEYRQFNIVKVQEAGCFEDIESLNGMKKKLKQNKTHVLELPLKLEAGNDG